jgi:predicted dehydrogenase
MTIKTVIVGMGAIGRSHASIVRHDRRMRLVSVVDPVVTATADPGVVLHADLEAALKGERPDLAIVATPPAAHTDAIHRLLEAGVPILCEKPLATDAVAARELADAAAEVPVLTAVDLQLRYDPLLQRLRATIAEGRIGKVLSVGVRVDVPGAVADPWGWVHDRAAGGGVSMEYGTHYLDVLGWLLGPLEVTSARAATLVPTRKSATGEPRPVTSDDWSVATLRSRAGVVASLAIGPTWAGGGRRAIDVVGTEGNLAATLDGLTLHHGTEPVDLTPDDYSRATWVDDAMARLVSDLVDHLTGAPTGPPGWATFDDAATAQDLVDRIRGTEEAGE